MRKFLNLSLVAYRQIDFKVILMLVIKLAATALGLYTTRWLNFNLDEQEVGLYYYGTIAYVGIVLAVLDLGLPKIVQKFYTNFNQPSETGRFWTTISMIRLLTYFIGVALILFTYRLSGHEDINLILFVYSLQFVLVADLNYRSICDALGHSWQFSLTDFGNRVIIVGGLFFSQYLRPGWLGYLEYLLTITFIAYIIGFTIDTFWQRKYTPYSKFDFKILKQQAKPMTLLGASVFLAQIYMLSRQIILNNFFSAEEYGSMLGAFGNADKVFIIAAIIPGLTMPMYASKIKRRLSLEQENTISRKLRSRFKLGLRSSIILESSILSLILGIVIAAGVFLFSPWLIQLIDAQNKFPLTLDAVRIFAVAMIPFALVFFMAHLQIFMGGEKYEFLGTLLLAILGLPLYFWVIPKYGIYGACWATVLIYFVDVLQKTIYMYLILRNDGGSSSKLANLHQKFLKK
ncbi:MAG: hypothetical protein OHK0017_05840 [Patescibacteria group bacterium]